MAFSQESTKGLVASWSPRKWTRRSSAASAVLTKVVDAILVYLIYLDIYLFTCVWK